MPSPRMHNARSGIRDFGTALKSTRGFPFDAFVLSRALDSFPNRFRFSSSPDGSLLFSNTEAKTFENSFSSNDKFKTVSKLLHQKGGCLLAQTGIPL